MTPPSLSPCARRKKASVCGAGFLLPERLITRRPQRGSPVFTQELRLPDLLLPLLDEPALFDGLALLLEPEDGLPLAGFLLPAAMLLFLSDLLSLLCVVAMIFSSGKVMRFLLPTGWKTALVNIRKRLRERLFSVCGKSNIPQKIRCRALVL